jgi:hypothetical protein
VFTAREALANQRRGTLGDTMCPLLDAGVGAADPSEVSKVGGRDWTDWTRLVRPPRPLLLGCVRLSELVDSAELAAQVGKYERFLMRLLACSVVRF